MPLGDFVSLQRGHDLPDERRRAGGVPILGSFGITGWHDVAKASGPGVTVGRSGASFGVVSYSATDFWPLNTALYVVDFHGNDERFAYYFLKSFDFTSFNSGSAQPSLNRNFIHPVPVEVPPLAEQRAIARVLGALDDKIELNRRTNETLEAMARALFKSWFVDFDPVRAKAEGWTFEEMGRHVESSRGFSYDGASISEGGMPFHNLNSIFEGGGYKFEGIKSLSGEFDDRRAVEPGDVIVANTEQGHDRLLLGSAAMIPMRYGPRTPYSHHLFRVRVRPGSPLRPAYVLHLLNDPWMHDLVSRYGNGTTVNMLPAHALELPLIAIPTRDVVATFESVVLPLHHRIENAVIASESLAALRDALLPKLLSGELRVPDAERIVEART